MSFADFIARVKRYDKNAEVIFDAQEPIGAATDLVMPRGRWFGIRTAGPAGTAALSPAAKGARRFTPTHFPHESR